jgi:hypothetical protein
MALFRNFLPLPISIVLSRVASLIAVTLSSFKVFSSLASVVAFIADACYIVR